MNLPIGLIVEDQHENIILFGDALRIERYEVVAAKDGLEALTWLEQNAAPQLIILDINMPKIDGYDLYQRIRQLKKFSDTSIIVTTANSYMARVIAPELVSGDVLMQKPLLLRELQLVARNIRRAYMQALSK